MTIALGDRKLIHTTWVAEIEPEGILGLDFLRKYECQLVLKDGCYELQFGTLPTINPPLPAAFEFLLKTPQLFLLGVRPW